CALARRCRDNVNAIHRRQRDGFALLQRLKQQRRHRRMENRRQSEWGEERRPTIPPRHLSRLGRLGDETYVTYAARSHYRQHSHHSSVRHAVIRPEIDAAASASLRERLETRREL